MTEKRDETAGPPFERRGVLRLLIQGFLSLWALGAAALGISFVKAPSSKERPNERLVRCGTLSSLPVGEARFVTHGSEPLFLLRASETELVAVSAICSHLRCILRLDGATGNLVCPCHAGIFDRNGNVLAGPPTRPLPRYRAEVRADQILVRT